VKQSEGHIMVTSEPGRGSTFKLYFPLARQDENPVEEKAAEPAAAEGIGHEIILLAEDEGAVRKLVYEVLRSAGYHVLADGDGEAALEQAQTWAGPIHLLITDVIMRKVGGTEVARRLARSRPGLRVLYISGFTGDAIVRNGILDDSIAFLQKPFSPAQLLSRVRRILDASAPNPAVRPAPEGDVQA
jgi:CheY-like chemotaxis protein